MILLAVAGGVVSGLITMAGVAPAQAAPASHSSPAAPAVKVAGQPVGIAADPATKTFWVAESDPTQAKDDVDRISETSHKVTAIKVAAGVAAVAADSARGLVWAVSNSGSARTLTFIRESGNAATAVPVTASSALEALAIDQSTGTVFMLDEAGDVFTISEAHPASAPVRLVTGTLNIATGIAVDPGTSTLWVLNAQGDSVLEFSETSGAQVGSPVPVGGNPDAVVADALAKTVWVANGDGSVSEFAEASTSSVRTLLVDSAASAITVDPKTSVIWVGTQSGAITGFSAKTAQPSPIGGPSVSTLVNGLATDPASGQLWAAEERTSQGSVDNVIPFVPSAATITSPASSWVSSNDPAERAFPVRAAGFPPARFSLSGAPSFVRIGQATGIISAAPTPTTKLGAFKFTIKAANGVGKTASQSFTLNLGSTPSGVSATATFAIGVKNTFALKVKATPAATFQGIALPSGLRLSKTGVLSGTVKKGTKSPQGFVVETSNQVTQAFKSPVITTFVLKLAPGKAARITTKSSVSFAHGKPASFTIKSTGFPAAALTEKGKLPKGLSFKGAANGTAVLSGTPVAADKGHTVKVTITAANGVGKAATQTLTIKIT